MLKYSVKPSKGAVLAGFPIKELYVSPDLLFISGVTDYNVGLVDGEKIIIKSPYLIGNEENSLNVANVKRQGKVKVAISLPVKSISTNLNFPIFDDGDGYYIIANNRKVFLSEDEYDGSEYILKGVTEKYVEYNGDISYFFNGNSGLDSGYIIDHKFYSANEGETDVTIYTYVYIEDGELRIDDSVYHVDFTEEKPRFKYDKSSKYVNAKNNNLVLGKLNGYDCTAVTDSNGEVVVYDYKVEKWERVSKFVIEKAQNPMVTPEDVLYGGYRHFVTFNGENYYSRKIFDEETGEYIGYGTKINGIFYPFRNNYGIDELYEFNHDLPFLGSSIYVQETDEYLDIEDSLVNQNDVGKFILFVDSNENDDIQVGNYIVAESQYPISIERYVLCEAEEDEEGEPICVNHYIVFQGKKYYVEERLCDAVTISDSEYILAYLDEYKTSASTVVNGETLYLDIKDFITISDEDYEISYDEERNAKVVIDDVEKNVTIDDGYVFIEGEEEEYELLHNATLSYKVYYDATKEEDEFQTINYGINETPYSIRTANGVVINGNKYEVLVEIVPAEQSDEDPDLDFNVRTEKHVNITENLNFLYEVTEVNGSSTYILYPVVDDETIDNISKDKFQREINEIVRENWKSFAFYVRKDTFGRNELTVENGLMNAMSAETPYTASDVYLLEKEIELLRINNYLSFKFPISNISSNNLMTEDILRNDFADSVKKNSINEIVDMEKDVYYPMWLTVNDELGTSSFRPIEQIRFNLHFRTRNLNNWRIIEDKREYISNDPSPNCNWFVTDDFYYTRLSEDGRKYLHDSSDILGFLNFSTDDVKYQATRLGKSFLRLSYYSSTDPNNQVLLHTSTIFFDESASYRKYANSKRNSDLKYTDIVGVQREYNATEDKSIYDNISDYLALLDRNSSPTITNFTELYRDEYLNDETRLSSRFTVTNKYMTDTSSEGFYLYMFKDYSRKTRMTTIYLKVEFNHAGIGKTIQFMLPRREDGTPLYLHNDEDVEILKEGFPMGDIYNQIYIPINIVYDEESNKYVYFLPEEIRENRDLINMYNEQIIPDEIMEFNLFEVKFANESIVDQNEINKY